MTYVLMASICEYHHRQTAEESYGAVPVDNLHITSVLDGVRGEVVDHEDNQVADGDQRDEACVFERIQAPQEAQRYDDKHESRDPEVPVHQEGIRIRIRVESPHDARHQVADDDEVRHADSKAFYSNSGVKYNSGVGVGKLRQGEEGRAASVEVSGAPRLQVKAEGGCDPGPYYYEYSQQHAHLRHSVRHRECSCADDGVEQVDVAA